MTSDRPPAVSVVIPAWNRRETLRASVESVLRQTFTDFELIVVDDGSTDGTMEAIADLADPRLRRLQTPHNMGASGARNLGIRAARGEWVAFQDSDDEWLPRKLEKQMARVEAAGPEVVACYTGMLRPWRPSGQGARTDLLYLPHISVPQVEGDLSRTILARSLVSTQMLMARRAALLQIGGFDEAMPALVDWELTIRLSRLGRFLLVDEPLVIQSFSENSLTHDEERRLRAQLRILEKHHAALKTEPQALIRHLVKIAGRMPARASRLQPLSAAIWGRRLRLWSEALTGRAGRKATGRRARE